MPRVTTVTSSRKEHKCGRCGVEIKKGDSYRHWSFRFGGKYKRCMEAKCSPRSSDLTQSKISSVYAAQESVEDALNNWDGFDLDDVKGALDELVDECETIAEEYEEAAEAMGDAGEENRERAENLSECRDTMESARDELEEYDGEMDDDDEPKDDTHAQAWKDDVISTVEGALGDCPL